jgi:hypothetical protein
VLCIANGITFYFPLMEYEGSIGLVTGKLKIFIADFHVFVLFMAKKHDLSDKKISICHATAVAVRTNFRHSLPLKS